MRDHIELNVERFYKFLNEHNIKDKWEHNTRIGHPSKGVDGYFIGMNSERQANKWIVTAFNWGETPEGWNYWNELNKLWISELHQNSL